MVVVGWGGGDGEGGGKGRGGGGGGGPPRLLIEDERIPGNVTYKSPPPPPPNPVKAEAVEQVANGPREFFSVSRHTRS